MVKSQKRLMHYASTILYTHILVDCFWKFCIQTFETQMSDFNSREKNSITFLFLLLCLNFNCL